MEIRKLDDKMKVTIIHKEDLEKIDKKLDKIMTMIKKYRQDILTVGCTTTADINKIIEKGE